MALESPLTSDRSTGALPTFLIIGAMRSGTTWLTRYLDAHPDAFCPVKEPHFFDRQWERGLDWYRQLYAGWQGETAVGEATPAYMYDPVALPRLAATLPQARLVAILRNPVDRAYSHYWHTRARGVEPLNFEDALAAEAMRLPDGDLRTRMRYSYVDRGRYLPQLQAVCTHFPREQLLVLLLEDLKARPHATLAALCRFLGIRENRDPGKTEKPANAHVTFRSLRVRRLSRRLPRQLRRVVGRLNSRRASYPPMDPTTREALTERFASHNLALGEWLGRDLSAPWAK